MVAAQSLLGVGLYTPAEAAFYARVPTRLITRWLYGTAGRKSVLRPQLSDEEGKLVTFLDLVQALAVRAIRSQCRVPLEKIRQTVEVAEKKFGVVYPFARDHKTFLLGQEVVLELDDGRLVQASGTHRGQPMMRQVIELYLRDLTFDPHGFASSYRPPVCVGKYGVVMDPKICFGEPVIRSCGYSALALWEAARAEGGIEEAAKAYGVTADEVALGCRYYDYLQGPADVAA